MPLLNMSTAILGGGGNLLGRLGVKPLFNSYM